jgi:hypothetical protein
VLSSSEESIMKLLKRTLISLLFLLGSATSVAVMAGGGHGGHAHGHVGVFIGAPLWGPWWSPGYYYPPYYSPYYYPPPYGGYPPAAASPPTYVERGDDAQSVPQDQAPPAWYYCPESKAYYPYVKECPGGWQQVAPQPPPGH